MTWLVERLRVPVTEQRGGEVALVAKHEPCVRLVKQFTSGLDHLLCDWEGAHDAASLSRDAGETREGQRVEVHWLRLHQQRLPGWPIICRNGCIACGIRWMMRRMLVRDELEEQAGAFGLTDVLH